MSEGLQETREQIIVASTQVEDPGGDQGQPKGAQMRPNQAKDQGGAVKSGLPRRGERIDSTRGSLKLITLSAKGIRRQGEMQELETFIATTAADGSALTETHLAKT